MPARYLILLFSLFTVSCKEYRQYPNGGYDYPKDLTASDTNLYYYQLKGIATERETFYDGYAYLFYKAFNEPNLSIRPQRKETFRITYRTAFHDAVIIVFNEDSLTVKKGNTTNLYKEDTTALTAIEKVHIELLERWFPIDTTGKKPWVKRYLDSMVKLYPQLLDPNYYRKLIDKTIAPGEKFSPEVTKTPITKEQYKSLIDGINTSGFWSMPYQIKCDEAIADGDGFTFEANTKKRYKFVSVRICPNDTSNFHKACQKIVEAAKLDKEIELIWWEKVSTSTDTVESVKVQDVTIEPVK